MSHPEILCAQNKWIPPHDRKQSIYVVKELITKEARNERPSMRRKAYETNKWRDTSDEKKARERVSTKDRSGLGKKDKFLFTNNKKGTKPLLVYPRIFLFCYSSL